MIVSTVAHVRLNVPVMLYLKIIPTTGLVRKDILPFQKKYTLSFLICVQVVTASAIILYAQIFAR